LKPPPNIYFSEKLNDSDKLC